MLFSPAPHQPPQLSASRNPPGTYPFINHPFLSPPPSQLSYTANASPGPWHNSPDFPSPYVPGLASFHVQNQLSLQSGSVRRPVHPLAYPSPQDDCASRLMVPYSGDASDALSRRPPSASGHLSSAVGYGLVSSPTQASSFGLGEDRASRALTFGATISSRSYTLSAAIPPVTATPSPCPSIPRLPSPSPPPSPSEASPPKSPERIPSPPPRPQAPPSVHAFRLDTLQQVDPADDPCPLSLHDLMIPSDEHEYHGHSYHFALRAMSPSTSAPPARVSEALPSHNDPAASKRKGKSKMHACSICSKAFPRPSGLRTHMNSHSGDKPYRCPVQSCAKSFTVRSNAKRHIRTHGIHSPSPQAAESTMPSGDSPIASSDRDSQRGLRIRWVHRGQDEPSGDHRHRQPLDMRAGSPAGNARFDNRYPSDARSSEEEDAHDTDDQRSHVLAQRGGAATADAPGVEARLRRSPRRKYP